MRTCYVPFDARENGSKRESACHRWVIPAEHSTSPTCPACRAFVEARNADTRTAEDVFGPAPALADASARPLALAPRVDVTRLSAAPKPPDWVQLFAQLATNKDIDVDKFERLMTLQERILDREACASFNTAFAVMQPEIPEIDQQGRILNKAGDAVQSTYAREEDIQRVLKPILARHGFGLSFRTEWPTPSTLHVVGLLTHRDGHTRESAFVTVADTSGNKNAIQALGSAVSYGHRYTTKDLLNITSRRQDDDGQGTTRHAAQRVTAPTVATVATVPSAGPAPTGFAAWWREMETTARQGFRALEAAWGRTPGAFKAHATKHQRQAWEALKADAAKVAR